MSAIPNSFASDPELSRGVSKLYGQLRENMQKSGGTIRGGFEQGFTSADGTVTVTLSTEGLKAYGGKDGDVGVHLKVLTRGPDNATSESNAMSDAIQSLDDVAAHEANMQQHMGKTEMIDNRGMPPEPLPAQPGEGLEDKAARLLSAASDDGPASGTAGGSVVDRLKARSEEGSRLADRLKKFLEDATNGSRDASVQRRSSPSSASSDTPATATKTEAQPKAIDLTV